MHTFCCSVHAKRLIKSSVLLLIYCLRHVSNIIKPALPAARAAPRVEFEVTLLSILVYTLHSIHQQ
jgi:hypothetical protein